MTMKTKVILMVGMMLLGGADSAIPEIKKDEYSTYVAALE